MNNPDHTKDTELRLLYLEAMMIFHLAEISAMNELFYQALSHSGASEAAIALSKTQLLEAKRTAIDKFLADFSDDNPNKATLLSFLIKKAQESQQ